MYMDHSDLTASNFMEKSIGPKRVKTKKIDFYEKMSTVMFNIRNTLFENELKHKVNLQVTSSKLWISLDIWGAGIGAGTVRAFAGGIRASNDNF